MRKHLTLYSLILACALTALPQSDKKNTKELNKSNLTGSWMLDRKKSNVGQSSQPDLPLKITYRDPELRIKRLYDHAGQMVERETVYYTDGRGETNPSTMILSTGTNMTAHDLEKEQTKSKTSCSGNKLMTRSIIRNLLVGHMMEFEIIDEWKLSEDSNTLTQTTRTIFRGDASDSGLIPANVPDIKRVYRRVPD
jgi:hypothetical protein